MTTPEEVYAGIPADIGRAYDRLAADGMHPDKVAEIVVAMKKLHASGKTDRTLEQQVDHLLDLRKALR